MNKTMWFLGACVGLSCLSCGSEGAEEPGSILVRWKFGGKTCQDLGVDTVRVRVLDSEGKELLDPAPTFPCASGEGLVEGVPPGTYEVIVEGLTFQGHAHYEGTRTGVKVDSGKPTEVSPWVTLELKKSEVLLNWEFPQGSGQCTGSKVVQVQVWGYDSSSSTVHSGEYPCILLPETYPDLGVLISGLRGNEEHTFVLYGLNNDTPPAITHHGEQKVTTVPGERSPVIVLLTPCPAPNQCP